MINDHFAAIANALSPRYRLERLLQSGIAAYVFVAEDCTTGGRVAVKVLRDEMSATVDADRFLAEIRVATELRHPNIVPVYHSGEIAGVPYFVMPFIEGETLRARLARRGRLTLSDALCIADDVARALDYAHRHHVVHRDIKPENVILDGGRAKVLDFGIALALDAVDAPRRTLPGMTLGTIHYMSPEQLDGDPSVDGRADLYSLGCVVYEMISGRPPFTGKPNAVVRRHLDELPKPLASVCPGVPPKVSATLARALEKSPDARFPLAGALASALRSAAPPVRARGRTIAVLPFTNTTADPAVDAFSDGISEEVVAALREYDGVAVASVVAGGPDATDLHITHLRRGDRADLILLGDVRRSDNGAALSIVGSLFDASTGRRLWFGYTTAAHHADRADIGVAARNAAAAIAGVIGVERVPEPAPAAPVNIPSIGRGRTLWLDSNGRSAAR
ncbi:MAG TPA: serine/threonine-protein kinase [Gemmatimonadaceae bacterium]|nr:serine/threonine-protein kinase [Gemmatimonadaceae bacterium]